MTQQLIDLLMDADAAQIYPDAQQLRSNVTINYLCHISLPQTSI